MADIINNIGVGQTYETVAAWAADVVNDGNRWVGNFMDATVIDLSTKIDMLPNVGGSELRADPSVAYDFTNPTKPHTIIRSNGGSTFFVLSTNKFIIRGFELENTGTSSSARVIGVDIYADADQEIHECRLKGGYQAISGRNSSASKHHFENCVISGTLRAGISGDASGVTTKSCVVQGCNTQNSTYVGGITTKSADTHVNTVSFNNGYKDFFAGSGVLTNCASSDTTATGTNNLTGVTLAAFEDPAADIWTSKAGGVLDGAGEVGDNIGLNLPEVVVGLSGTVTVTSLKNNDFYQRDGATKTVSVAGTYDLTLEPTTIAVSLNGGEFVTLDPAPTGNQFIGSVDLVVGVNVVTVRVNDSETIQNTAFNIRLGDKYFTAISQSNHTGGHGSGDYDGLQGYAAEYFESTGEWADLDNAGTDSYLGELANLIVANTGVPVGFVQVAVGSTSVSQWQEGGALMTDAITAYTNSGAEGFYNLMWIGETDASTNTGEAEFKADANAAIDYFFAQTGMRTMMMGLALSGSGQDNVRQWTAEIAASNPNADYGVDMSTIFDALHYETEADTLAIAQAVWTRLSALFYLSTTINLTVSGIPDGLHRIYLDNSAGARVFASDVTFTSEAASIPNIPLEAGEQVFGYWKGTNPPSDGTGIFGVTE